VPKKLDPLIRFGRTSSFTSVAARNRSRRRMRDEPRCEHARISDRVGNGNEISNKREREWEWE